MEFIRSLLIIDKSNDESAQIKKQVMEKSSKFSVFTLSGRAHLAETVNENDTKYLFLNANIGKKEVFYILRFFTMLNEKNKSEIPIFFACEDYELLQEVLTDFSSLKKLQVLHTPLDIGDLVEKLYISAFGSTIDASKTKKGDLNVDLEFMNVFITSTIKTLAEMAQISELIHSSPILMSQVKEPLNIAISSKIMISSIYFKGSYYIAFPKETFFNFYEKVVMEKCTEINNDNKDFVSELANIIYGQCKKKFSDVGYNLDMVIPSIHLGEINYSVVVLIPFNSPFGKFYLAVAPGLI